MIRTSRTAVSTSNGSSLRTGLRRTILTTSENTMKASTRDGTWAASPGVVEPSGTKGTGERTTRGGEKTEFA